MGKELFETFENDVLNDISLQVLLTLQKTETMITATVELEGTAELVCDRSLRTFGQKVDLKETVYYKFGEEYNELSDEVVIIPFNYGELDFAQLIYDTLILSIPPKVIHPDLQNEEGDEKVETVPTNHSRHYFFLLWRQKSWWLNRMDRKMMQKNQDSRVQR